MSGHVFVVHGDLTHLACDDWLLPTDRDLTLTAAWLPAFAEDAVDRDGDVPRLRFDASPFDGGDHRVAAVPRACLHEPHEGSPITTARAWLLDVGTGDEVDPDWLVAGVRAWLDATTGCAQSSDRARRLLALPLVGTGAGGAAGRRDAVLAALLPALLDHAEAADVDVALVLNDERDHAAAQVVRRGLGQRCWDLPDDLVAAVGELADLAHDRRLALFLGAGVSRAAGLPLWRDLIEELADAAGVDAATRRGLARLDVEDQMEVVAGHLAGGTDALREWLRRRFAPRPHALAHALLAGLPVREAVTTNWDPLFDQAVADTGRRVAVLPADAPGGADTWLLKLHGDARDGHRDLVARRSDYLRFGAEQSALAGLVHALLLTRHVLFVGFSLVDDNFIRIADDVTRVADRRLGTTLALRRDPAKEALWPHLEHLAVDDDSPDADPAELARRLEITLDLLAARVHRDQAYLLDCRYAGLLDGPDRRLAERLGELAAAAPELADAASWPRVQALLSELGHPGDDK